MTRRMDWRWVLMRGWLAALALTTVIDLSQPPFLTTTYQPITQVAPCFCSPSSPWLTPS